MSTSPDESAGTAMVGAPAPERDPRLRDAGEVVRADVVALLEHRWDRTVTTIVAPAGFGKSTALAQAMRSDRLAPRGIEGQVSCRWGCENAVRFVASATEALGARRPPSGSPLARLQSAVADLAPLPVCLAIDDAETMHHTGAQLIGDLLDARPSNLHLVLVGRSLPPVGLARLRAAGELLEITAADLRFDVGEIAALAQSLGAEVPEDEIAGWPAMIRLSLAAPGRAANDYLWEEVIRRLSTEDRRALQALCALGSGTVAEVARVSGARLDAGGFCARVPLVSRDGDTLVAHQLWAPFLADLGVEDGPSMATLSARASAVVGERGDVVADGQLAIRLGDQGALRRAAVALVYERLGMLPLDIAEAWLAAADPESAASPQMRLLACALSHSRVAGEPTVEELDAVLQELEDDGEPGDLVGGLAFAVLAAYETGDLGRLLTLSIRADSIELTNPVLEQLHDAVAAASRLYQGDIEGALACLDRPRPPLPLGLRPEAVTRLHWHLLLLAGRAADAAVVAEAAGGHTPTTGRPLEAVARWLDGDPSALDPEAEDLGPGRYADLSARDRFDFASFIAPMAASLPGTEGVDVAVGVLTSSTVATDGAPDGALVAVGRAAHCIVHHDEAGAVAEIGRFVSGGPLDALTDAHLRRSLVIPYVCSTDLRAAWDEAPLGPSQARARRIAAALVRARDDSCADQPPGPPGAIAATLPCPWAVELAARAAADGRPWGSELFVDLVDRFGDGVREELVRARLDGTDDVRRGAAIVERALPSRPPTSLTVSVLGPMTLRRGEDLAEPAELRRVRVRELLSVLLVERAVSRDRVIELIWPEQAPSKGRANLRVTLAHLQNALEPDRGRDDPPYFVRATPSRLSLASSTALVVDLWDIERFLGEADEAASAGDVRTRVVCLEAAVDRWRGRALPDLDGVAELAAVGAAVERRLVGAALTLGEMEVVGGSADRASRRAERVLAADSYDERAHRLAIAARLEAGDRPGVRAAIDRLRVMLDDLGVPPEERTQVLLRHAGHRQATEP